MKQNFKKWFSDNGDYTHRLNYNLTKKSIVFDLGGYLGWFTENIYKRYNCNVYTFEPIEKYAKELLHKFKDIDDIKVFHCGISNENKTTSIYLSDDASSMYQKTNNIEEIKCYTLDHVMQSKQVSHINLLKVNIEGEEYPLLKYIIDNNLHLKIDNLQIQFHTFIDDYETKYNYIYNKLKDTHNITYKYDFIWENWEKK